MHRRLIRIAVQAASGWTLILGSCSIQVSDAAEFQAFTALREIIVNLLGAALFS